MSELHHVINELFQQVRNVIRQFSLAYQSAAEIFENHPTLIQPYQHIFNQVGSDLANYYQKLGVLDGVSKTITPLQAAFLISDLLQQDSFFLICESIILAQSQVEKTMEVVKQYFAQQSDETGKQKIEAALGSGTWVFRLKELVKNLEKVVKDMPEQQGKCELEEVYLFFASFAEAIAQYTNSLEVFQKEMVPQTIGEVQHVGSQLLQQQELTLRELTGARQELEDITNCLNGMWAVFYQHYYAMLSPNLVPSLTQKIAALEENARELSARIQAEQKEITGSLQMHKTAFKNLQEMVKDLNKKIDQQHPALSNSIQRIAWKAALLSRDVSALQRCFNEGLDPDAIRDYLLSNSNRDATVQSGQISPEVMVCIATARDRKFSKVFLEVSKAESSQSENSVAAGSSQYEAKTSVPVEELKTTKTKASDADEAYKKDTLKRLNDKKIVSERRPKLQMVFQQTTSSSGQKPETPIATQNLKH